MGYKTEYIDLIGRNFNSFNKQLDNLTNNLVEAWDLVELLEPVNLVKNEYDLLRENLQFLFTEIRKNLLILKDTDEINSYRKYCEISLTAIRPIITPQKIETVLKQQFKDIAFGVDESYFLADMSSQKGLDYYDISNFLYTHSLLALYYFNTLKNIIEKLPTSNLDDANLTSLDKEKNTISQKLLLLYYLSNDKKINLNLLSQDTTKQARVLSFLFDNSYENIRKKLSLIHESKSHELKRIDNLTVLQDLLSILGNEFDTIKTRIAEDLIKQK